MFDLGAYTLAPGTSWEVQYDLRVVDFDFGELGIGLLELDTDPDDGRSLGVNDVSTTNNDLRDLFAQNNTYQIPESDFAGPDAYGDITFSLSK